MINSFAAEIPASYLFSEIGNRVRTYQKEHPDKRIIRMGIGDVTQPLPAACVAALHKAADEMARAETFRGYGPDQGYDFLREAIAREEYQSRGAPVFPDEVFISDGAKSDSANIQELFDDECVVGVTDPVYPVYIDSNAMAGRLGHLISGKWTRLITFPCTEVNGFVASPPHREVDLIYLCFPNNPTGATASAEQLKAWVDYALDHRAVILFDAAYRAYITNPDVPRSIYEIEGARECAVEICSFSKTAGFTGLRCSWTVVPNDLNIDGIPLKALWLRRQVTKYNGTPYIVQRAAEAVYTPEGKEQVAKLIGYYMENAARMRGALESLGLTASGGVNSPYVWMKCPGGQSSWDFFDRLLRDAQIVGTPGSGFGTCGEGYFRLTAFGTHEDTEEAIERLRKII